MQNILELLLGADLETRKNAHERARLQQAYDLAKELCGDLRRARLAIALGTVGENMRMEAIIKLSADYRRTDDREASRVLATIVRDEGSSTIIRLSAYASLFEVSTRDYEDYPSFESLGFPENVDWGFVQRFLDD